MTQLSDTKTSSLRSRWFAGLWSKIDAGIDDAMRPAKDATLVDLPDTVVEIGVGLGSNFPRYPSGAGVIGFEPNRHMHDRLREAATEHGIDLDLRPGGAEQLDLETGSVDTVVSTLTLCSVDDPEAAIAEIRRVLAPGGRFLFIEHVAAPDGTVTAWAQRILNAPWGFVADHCRLTAATETLINDAEFASVEYETAGLGPRLDPSRRTIFGVARR